MKLEAEGRVGAEAHDNLPQTLRNSPDFEIHSSKFCVLKKDRKAAREPNAIHTCVSPQDRL